MTQRVAVLLGGYGEVEHDHEHEDYNDRALRLLVSKSVRFPERVIPLMAKMLGRRTRNEWQRENHYHSPHNDISNGNGPGSNGISSTGSATPSTCTPP